VALGALMLEPLIGEQRPRSRSRARSRAASLALVAALGGLAAAPRPAAAAPAEQAEYPDPWSAYEAGAYDEARAGFLERKVERPEEVDLEMGVGASSYKLGEWEVAQRAFESAAASGDSGLRAEALYNLGNTAFRLGRLEVAFDRVVDLIPETGLDED